MKDRCTRCEEEKADFVAQKLEEDASLEEEVSNGSESSLAFAVEF